MQLDEFCVFELTKVNSPTQSNAKYANKKVHVNSLTS